ncbi:phosphoadenylyl-sulfate reductase [Thermobifida alba]|uniref:Adenosine 5'-phosphosulfate reductase n=1 Tax=Thermobifida alba TaxID=53522 RepID=A0ABY4L6X6_THEAE|nr:phosphoadenylyl-sulfate reductase [Thermobifida alba]UPT23430.1 phosphoadenylyl-sulfate reductase [Thermobifida alba]HLU95840.1 phosphoadenylyl-sulfate reductase [Thermobifida alba]
MVDGAAFAAAAAAELEEASATEIIRWAADTFGDRLCLTSSMADALMVDLVSGVVPGIDVIFLDTGYHFPETLGTRDAVAQTYPVNLITVQPTRTVAEQDRDLGPRLYGRDPNLCCHLRKVEPLQRALEPYDAWLTGLRRDEAVTRRDVGVVQWDARKKKVKVNPIARWTQADVDAYVAERGVLVNPLQYDGYPSIGCAPCTRRVAEGADPRSGRWAGTGKVECGLHV